MEEGRELIINIIIKNEREREREMIESIQYASAYTTVCLLSVVRECNNVLAVSHCIEWVEDIGHDQIMNNGY